MSLFKPKMYQKSIFTINYDKLKTRGYKLLIFDLDNTIGLVSDIECNNKTKLFLNKLALEFEILIVSNNSLKRVKTFCNKLHVKIFPNAFKPTLLMRKFVKSNYNIEPNNVVLIGDQLLTDIAAGNRYGCYTIFVDKLGESDLKITSLNRLIEKYLMKRINLQKGVYYEKI